MFGLCLASIYHIFNIFVFLYSTNAYIVVFLQSYFIGTLWKKGRYRHICVHICSFIWYQKSGFLNTFMQNSRDITFPTKVHLVKAMVFPVVMYGCDSWTVKKAERRRIDAFELWCWRRLLRVPWTARRCN